MWNLTHRGRSARTWPMLAVALAIAACGSVYAARVMENDALKVTLDPARGTIAVLDKGSRYTWRQPAQPAPSPFHDVVPVPDGLRFRTSVGWDPGYEFPIVVTLTLPAHKADLVVECDLPDRRAKVNVPFLPPFVMDSPNGAIAIADGCDGHLYPADIEEFPGASRGMRTPAWYPSDRLDMPWVGVCDLSRGMGYTLILDTPEDGILSCVRYTVGERKVWAPRMIWTMSMGHFRYPRRMIYRFTSRGGYVAQAKAYRDYAQSRGLIVPLAEKAKRNPNVTKLFGAPSVWGRLDLQIAREAKAAGVDRMLMQRLGDWLQVRPSAQDVAAINDLGYLTGEYDNFVDIYPSNPGEPAASNRGRVPEDAAITSDGEPMKAWWDGTRYATKRCPELYASAVESVLGDLIERWPFTARFLDVAAAQDLFECYNLRHPLSRLAAESGSAEHFAACEKLGLVVGAEHGVWWAVPHVDYFEGMMSAPFYSWSTSYLRHPKSKDDSVAVAPGETLSPWSDYARWAIGHEYRVPLWELVFHDCVVTNWYWGDSNDWLLDAAPEVTERKTAFNILYGSAPMLWTDAEGSWNRDRAAFMRVYRNACKLGEVIADKEMLSHEFLTADRAVQRSRFAGGASVVVNFGEAPREVSLGGRRYTLPRDGFAVVGPSIRQSRELVGGRMVTRIAADGYRFSDESGVGITLRRLGRDIVRVNVDSAAERLLVSPRDALARNSGRARVYKLGPTGDWIGEAAFSVTAAGLFDLGVCTGPSAFDIVFK